MMNDKIKVSVIVPMYNVAKVVHRAVETLMGQTLEGLELIFVDDCSSDGSLERLQALLPEKEGVTVRYARHEVNRGVAAARNTGLGLATGEYIYYVDADDYLEPMALERMYRTACEEQAEIVGCEWYLSFEQRERVMRQAEVTTGEELFRSMANGVLRWNLWLFMVKRCLYEEHGVRFTERMNMGEDMMVMMKLALHAGRVKMIHEPLYHYIQTNEGALTKNFGAYREQVTANANEVERYVHEQRRTDLAGEVMQLKLTLKLPLLISDRQEDYETWMGWFPEANGAIRENRVLPWRTRFIQQMAAKRRFWVVRLYYYLIIKLVYGVIYK